LKDHANVTKDVKRNNNVVIPKELTTFCSPEIDDILCKSSHYQESVMAISNLEKSLIEDMIGEVIGNPSNILVEKKDWPVSMVQNHSADQSVAIWLQRKVKQLAIDGTSIWPPDVDLKVKMKKSEDIAIKL